MQQTDIFQSRLNTGVKPISFSVDKKDLSYSHDVNFLQLSHM